MSSAGAEQVALFGGSFDPPHTSHVSAAKHVLATREVDKVLVVPVGQHALGKELTPFQHRFAMCELAFAGISGVLLSRVESSLPVPSRTLNTLQALAVQHPTWSLRLMIGADVLKEAPLWHRFDEVCRVAPPLVLGREGVQEPLAPAPMLPKLSSSEVRQLLREGRGADLLGRVPANVLQYIAAHGLYE